MKAITSLFLRELASIYDAEKITIHALPKLAKAAAAEVLKRALRNHEKETECQIGKLDRIFKSFGMKAKRKPCRAVAGLFDDAHDLTIALKGSPALDAGLTATAQLFIQFKLTAYGIVHDRARLLGNRDASQLLLEALLSEKLANESFAKIARQSEDQWTLVAVTDTDIQRRSTSLLFDPWRGTNGLEDKVTPALPSLSDCWRTFRRRR